jgi:hypothetical protein
MSKRTPAASARSISASAISPLVRATMAASGTPARTQRVGSSVHVSGKNSRSATGTGTSSRARVSDTST